MKKLLALLLAGAMVFSVAACGGSEPAAEESAEASTELNIYMWQQYISDELIANFEAENNCKINLSYMSDNADAINKLTAGGGEEYDLIMTCDAYMESLIAGGYVEEINLDNVPNSANLNDAYWVSKGYCVPYLMNYIYVVYDSATCPIEITGYNDLLDPKYRDLISMPNPTSSGTGYMFLLAMVNQRGEDEAFAYFDKLSENVLQFTSSGSGPVNALIQGEVAIGLGIIGTAVKAINDGAELEIIFFEEGAPYALYGQGMIKGKDDRPAVKAVFDYLYSTYGYLNCENFFPERIYADRTFTVENYPDNIPYSDMSGDTAATKDHLLAKWTH